jgi:hypothetical protein
MKIEPIVIQGNASSKPTEIEKFLRDRLARLGEENKGSKLQVSQLTTYANGANIGIVAIVEIG